MTRFSPAELEALDRKRALERVTRSGLIRAAVAAYEPAGRQGNDIRETEERGPSAIRKDASEVDCAIRVEYDPTEQGNGDA